MAERCRTAVTGRRRSCTVHDVTDLVSQLEQVQTSEGARWTTLRVAGHTFGYLWPDTNTVGLKQLLHEQLALIAERPDTFEDQFSAGGFGWVVVHLERVGRRELAELIFEAWRLTAPRDEVEARGDVLPR